MLVPWEDSVAVKGLWVLLGALLKGHVECGTVEAASERIGVGAVLLDSMEMGPVVKGKDVSSLPEVVADVGVRGLLDSAWAKRTVEETSLVISASVLLGADRVALLVGKWFSEEAALEVSEDSSSVLDKGLVWGVFVRVVLSDGT